MFSVNATDFVFRLNPFEFISKYISASFMRISSTVLDIYFY